LPKIKSVRVQDGIYNAHGWVVSLSAYFTSNFQVVALNPTSPLRIALVAGETSGDQLGGPLITALRAHYPDAEFAGIGGPLMQAAGLQAWHQADELAVMGLVEVLRHLPRLLGLRKSVRQRLLQWRPDVFIGIDAPDFNLGLERSLRQAGIRTLHYVSPSVWAWRENRAEKIGASADRVLCLFPMEPPIYARHGVDARFVGHPLADRFELNPHRESARRELGIADDAQVLALLPGSRLSEIQRLAAPFIAAGLICKQAMPALQLIAPMATPACRSAFENILAAHSASDQVRCIDGQSHQAMIAADAVLVASGTAALEVMLAKRPMVVAYRIAALSYWIVRTFGLLKSNVVSLPNILAGEPIVPELLQDDCRGDRLAAALLPLLQNRNSADAQITQFHKLHLALQGGGAGSAAAAVAELIDAARA
jgi:lipid-A-disaccharide synthase